ncbi:MAG: class I SAM-dependent methyltransferase [Solirubrobacteraceae bacterium]
MRDYYEELWERLPRELSPPDWQVRSTFLLGELGASDRLLDVGCGAGEFTAIADRAGAQAVGVEIAEAALRRARSAHPGLDLRRVEIDGLLPFEDGSFEIVWASEVIEHVADTARWLSELRRVLAPRGRLLITTPSHGRVRVALGGVERFSPPLGDHLHLYTGGSLASVLAEFGLGAVRVRTAGGPPWLRRLLLARAQR